MKDRFDREIEIDDLLIYVTTFKEFEVGRATRIYKDRVVVARLDGKWATLKRSDRVYLAGKPVGVEDWYALKGSTIKESMSRC